MIAPIKQKGTEELGERTLILASIATTLTLVACTYTTCMVLGAASTYRGPSAWVEFAYATLAVCGFAMVAVSGWLTIDLWRQVAS
ncbi:MAG: hypothetical protein KBE09_01760 [Candidatus Pacebacteria bacterium]|nr:hypothetical protein [Candidatus Paceibacterota bacterium]